MNFQDAINAQKSGELQKADKIYKKLLNQNPENFEILFNYAVLNFDLKNYIKSEDLFKKAIFLNAHNHQVFNGYGVLLKELNIRKIQTQMWVIRKNRVPIFGFFPADSPVVGARTFSRLC